MFVFNWLKELIVGGSPAADMHLANGTHEGIQSAAILDSGLSGTPTSVRSSSNTRRTPSTQGSSVHGYIEEDDGDDDCNETWVEGNETCERLSRSVNTSCYGFDADSDSDSEYNGNNEEKGGFMCYDDQSFELDPRLGVKHLLPISDDLNDLTNLRYRVVGNLQNRDDKREKQIVQEEERRKELLEVSVKDQKTLLANLAAAERLKRKELQRKEETARNYIKGSLKFSKQALEELLGENSLNLTEEERDNLTVLLAGCRKLLDACKECIKEIENENSEWDHNEEKVKTWKEEILGKQSIRARMTETNDLKKAQVLLRIELNLIENEKNKQKLTELGDTALQKITALKVYMESFLKDFLCDSTKNSMVKIHALFETVCEFDDVFKHAPEHKKKMGASVVQIIVDEAIKLPKHRSDLEDMLFYVFLMNARNTRFLIEGLLTFQVNVNEGSNKLEVLENKLRVGVSMLHNLVNRGLYIGDSMENVWKWFLETLQSIANAASKKDGKSNQLLLESCVSLSTALTHGVGDLFRVKYQEDDLRQLKKSLKATLDIINLKENLKSFSDPEKKILDKLKQTAETLVPDESLLEHTHNQKKEKKANMLGLGVEWQLHITRARKRLFGGLHQMCENLVTETMDAIERGNNTQNILDAQEDLFEVLKGLLLICRVKPDQIARLPSSFAFDDKDIDKTEFPSKNELVLKIRELETKKNRYFRIQECEIYPRLLEFPSKLTSFTDVNVTVGWMKGLFVAIKNAKKPYLDKPVLWMTAFEIFVAAKNCTTIDLAKKLEKKVTGLFGDQLDVNSDLAVFLKCEFLRGCPVLAPRGPATLPHYMAKFNSQGKFKHAEGIDVKIQSVIRFYGYCCAANSFYKVEDAWIFLTDMIEMCREEKVTPTRDTERFFKGKDQNRANVPFLCESVSSIIHTFLLSTEEGLIHHFGEDKFHALLKIIQDDIIPMIIFEGIRRRETPLFEYIQMKLNK